MKRAISVGKETGAHSVAFELFDGERIVFNLSDQKQEKQPEDEWEDLDDDEGGD
ncbi:MAG: hypothetical protein KAH44_09625 [Oricola sp.]|nr:hypothetical protein [Oricola sp.]